MCRNIKILFNFDPPATDMEIHEAALQFVRKLSGTTRPSEINKTAFDLAVSKIEISAKELITSMVTTAQPKNREAEAMKAKLKSEKRFSMRN